MWNWKIIEAQSYEEIHQRWRLQERNSLNEKWSKSYQVHFYHAVVIKSSVNMIYKFIQKKNTSSFANISIACTATAENTTSWAVSIFFYSFIQRPWALVERRIPLWLENAISYRSVHNRLFRLMLQPVRCKCFLKTYQTMHKHSNWRGGGEMKHRTKTTEHCCLLFSRT